jgi:hypothetical protein
MRDKETGTNRTDKGGTHVMKSSNYGHYKQPDGKISGMCAAGKHEPKCISLSCCCECHNL